MSEGLSKQGLLEDLDREHRQWEALLAAIGTHRMERIGVTPGWSIKDTVAHLTTWWRREVARLAAAGRGERPPDHPSQGEVQIINEWIYLTNRDRPLIDVLRDADDTWRQCRERLQVLPDETLCDPGRFDWMEGRALGPAILHDFVTHLHEEHEPLIRQWLQGEPGD